MLPSVIGVHPATMHCRTLCSPVIMNPFPSFDFCLQVFIWQKVAMPEYGSLCSSSLWEEALMALSSW
jgi:uncharacterized protein Usg